MKSLNIIIYGFEGSVGSAVLKKALQEYHLHYALRMCRYKEDAPLIDAYTLDWVGHGFLSTVDWNTIAPVDAEIVEKMAHAEIMAMDMLSRQETNGRVLPYAERKRSYLQMLTFWNHLLTDKKIDVLLSYQIPHRPQIYVLYMLCKLRGIPTICFDYGLFHDTLLLVEDWTESSVDLGKEYKRLYKQYDSSKEEIQLSNDYEQFYREQVEATLKPSKRYQFRLMSAPDHMRFHFLRSLNSKKNKVSEIVRILFRSIETRCHLSYWGRVGRSFVAHHRARRMFHYYDKHAIAPDFSQKYFFVPLQMQPEGSTCPMAGAYCEQRLLVTLLAACLPRNILIYVKEHPTQQSMYPDGRGRDESFYKDLLKIKQVRLIKRDQASFPLQENCIAVATGTGTAGFEAIFREKPVLMFGHHFYQFAPGVIPIRTVIDCKNAIRKIVDEGFKPELSLVRVFLKAVENIIIPACVDPYLLPTSRISHKETVQHMGTAIQKKLATYLEHS